MEPDWSSHFFGGVVILDPDWPLVEPGRGAPPDDVVDSVLRIAKVWGCVCRPTITQWQQDTMSNVLTAKLHHSKGCHYRPASFFEPEVPIDTEAIAESAARMRKLRQRTVRKYAKRKG